MGRSETKAADCDYNEYDRRLNKQFIHGLGNEGMISEIVREVSASESIDDATSEQGLLWVQRVKTKTALKEALDNIKVAKDFDPLDKNIQKDDNMRHKEHK